MKKKRILLGIALTAASIFALSSCGGNSNNSGEGDPSGETESDKFTVKFDTQGGSKIDDVKVAKNTPVTKPTDPTRTGYEFKGWFKEKACTNEWDFTKAITENRTLYAKWEQKDMVTGIELSGEFKTRYKKGDTFDASGLVVTELHTKDDDVVLSADKYTITLEDEAGQAVDATAPFTATGFYTATVKGNASQKTDKFDFKVTAKAETITDYAFGPDQYGTAKSLTKANVGLTANEEIASLAEGKARLVATGAKVKYQQVDSNNNSVAATYNSVEYGSRLQVNTGTADGAIKIIVNTDADLRLYAKGDIGRGIKVTNVDTTKSSKDPQACEFVTDDGDKEVMRVFDFYLNAGEYYINSTTGGGVNIYNFIVSLYEPQFNPDAPITDLAFSPTRTVFYESEVLDNTIMSAGQVNLAAITDGLTVTSTKDEVPGNPVAIADCTFALYKGETQVTELTDAGTYKVQVTVGGYSKAYDITYSKSTKFELASPYTTLTVQKNTDLNLLGYAKVTMDNTNTVFYGVDPEYVTIKYYTTKGKDAEDKDVYSDEVSKSVALGTAGKVYAEVEFDTSLLPLACFADTEASNKTKIYFEVTVQDGKAPDVWNYQLDNYVPNYVSLVAGKKTDKTVTGPKFISGAVVTANSAIYKASGSFGCDGVELTKGADELTITVASGYTATIAICVGSTSSTNDTDKIYLKSGETIVSGTAGSNLTKADDNTFTVTGNGKTNAITYTNLAAGTYKFGTSSTARNVRVYDIVITYTAA